MGRVGWVSVGGCWGGTGGKFCNKSDSYRPFDSFPHSPFSLSFSPSSHFSIRLCQDGTGSRVKGVPEVRRQQEGGGARD